jgi:hypothetical protein
MRVPGYDSATAASDHPIIADGGSGQFDVSPFFAGSMPGVNAGTLAVVFKNPTTAMGFVSGKRSVSGTTQLYYLKWSKLFLSTTEVVEVAIRMVPGQIEVLTLPAADATGVYFQVFRLDDSTTNHNSVGGNGSYVEALAVSTTEYFLADPPPVGNFASGFSSTAFGSPSMLGNVTAAATGSAFGAFGSPTTVYDPPNLALLIFRDNFTGANSTHIDVRSPDYGDDWTHSGGGYDAAGRIHIWDNAAQNNNALYYPAYYVPVPVADNTYRIKIAFKLPATLVNDSALLLIEESVNGPAPYTIRCFTDTNSLDINLFGADNGSAADAFSTAYYHDDSSAASSTIVVELIVDQGRASWFYVDGALHDYRIRAVEGESPSFINLALAEPSLAVDYVEVYAEAPAYTPPGFSSTTFGATGAIWDQFPAASGFLATTFGTPEPVGLAFGFQPTTFGGAAAYPGQGAASLGELTQFGTPHWVHPTAGEATGLLGTKYGKPHAHNYVPAFIHQLTYAAGALGTAFGAPNAAWPLAGDASGSTFGAFGTPAAHSRFGASGAAFGAFGTPGASVYFRAAGAKTTAFGAATSVKGVAAKVGAAAPLYRATRWGLPRALKSNTYEARGWRTGRFGRATGYSRFNYPATGFTGTQLGTPVAVEGHRVTHIAPTTMFGTPLLERAQTC